MYGNIQSVPKEWKKDTGLEEEIRIIQLDAINQLILQFHRSHFEVDLLGIIAINNELPAYKSEKINLLPFYQASHSTPLVIIDSDTLKYNGLIYEYEWKGKDKGTYFIETEIVVERWNELRSYKPTFRIDVH